LDDLHIDGKIILERIIKCDQVAQTGVICLRWQALVNVAKNLPLS